MTNMDVAGKKKALKQASGLRASGGTALCQGLVDGVNMMRKRTTKNEIASVMILTDGQANQGPTSASEINASVRKGKVLSVQGGIGGYGGPPRIQMMQNIQIQQQMQQAPPQLMQNMMNSNISAQQQMPQKRMARKMVKKQKKPGPPKLAQKPQQMQIQGGPPGPPAPPGPPKLNDMIESEETKQQPEGDDVEGSEELQSSGTYLLHKKT